MKKTVASLPQAGALLIAIALTGCGGGGGDDSGGGPNPPPPPPPPQTAQGVFKDSNVSGLSYTSGGQTGVTTASGGFTYETGAQITFRVGNVSLGSTAGKALITPVDLVATGTGASPEVLNRVRFLMMLDDNGNPLDGINIVDGIRTRAQQWTQVDFATADLPAALATIRADAQSATGGTHVLPDATAARTHLEATFLCAYSGGFRGTYAGDDAGRWGMLVFPNGNVFGIGYSITEDEGFTTGGINTATVAVDNNRAFISGRTTTGASFSGRFTSPDAVSGTWQFAGTTDDGTFTGTRLGGLANAVYRFSGAYVESGGGDAGLFTFDVNASDAVTGFAYSIPDDDLLTITGQINGTTLTGTSSSGMSFTATLNKQTGSLSAGTYQGGGVTGSFSGAGCRLN